MAFSNEACSTGMCPMRKPGQAQAVQGQAGNPPMAERRRCRGTCPMSRPSTVMRPVETSVSRRRQLTRELLPAPAAAKGAERKLRSRLRVCLATPP